MRLSKSQEIYIFSFALVLYSKNKTWSVECFKLNINYISLNYLNRHLPCIPKFQNKNSERKLSQCKL